MPRATTATPKVSEKQEQAAIIQLLESIGGKVYVLGTRRPAGDYQGTRQTPGIPDVFAFLPAKGMAGMTPIWIEVKRLGGRVRPAQAEFAVNCHHACICHICGTCDDVIKWLTLAGWLR